MYGVSNYLDFEAMRHRAERAEALARQWRRVSLGMICVAIICLAAMTKAVIAAEPEPVPDVLVSCWRFDSSGARRLVWSATGRRAWVEQRGDRQVLVLEQSVRTVEHEVADGQACVIGPELRP